MNIYLCRGDISRMAEGVGFEPTRACALPVFKTGAINRSTTPPVFDARELCHRPPGEQAIPPEHRLSVCAPSPEGFRG
jgi:hypothetical protein